MFDRSGSNTTRLASDPSVPAELTLDDGHVVKGKFHVSGTRPIFEVLNGNGLFLDFEQHTGERELIAKSAIRAIKLVTVPRPKNLTVATSQNDTFDPHAILGIKQGASFDDTRTAYHRLSKVYHPDRYAGSSLPKEVIDYLNAASRRINAAFAALNKPAKPQPQQQPQPRARATPIYTSESGRA